MALAREIERRPQIELDALMAYEGQIAGVGDEPPGRRLRGAAIRFMQRRSAKELAERRGGDRRRDRRVLRAADRQRRRHRQPRDDRRRGGGDRGDRGLRLLRPHPLRQLQPLHPDPGGRFALPIVRKPAPEMATALGGGYLASGAGDAARLPSPWLPAGPEARPRGGRGRGPDAAARRRRRRASRSATASTCATPRRASSASASTPSTWSKASEIVDVVPTYRGEGKTFL